MSTSKIGCKISSVAAAKARANATARPGSDPTRVEVSLDRAVAVSGIGAAETNRTMSAEELESIQLALERVSKLFA